MDEQFEKQLNESVLSSAHPAETKAEAILSAYHTRREAKKPSSYKVPFFGALGAFGCAVVALGFLIPASLSGSVSTSSIPSDNFVLKDIPTSPLQKDSDVLGYEVSILYPLFAAKKTSSPTLSIQRAQNSNKKESFSSIVDTYETVENPVRSTFLCEGGALSVESVSYQGQYATYENKMAFSSGGTLYFNATSLNGRWSQLSGELVDQESKVWRLEGAQRSNDDSSSALGIKLFGAEQGEYALVEQNQNEGRFYFSFQLFSSYQLSSSLSLRRMNTDSDSPFIIVKAFSSTDYETASFRVLEEADDRYAIYGTSIGKISLSYENSQRTYQYNGTTIVK